MSDKPNCGGTGLVHNSDEFASFQTGAYAKKACLGCDHPECPNVPEGVCDYCLGPLVGTKNFEQCGKCDARYVAPEDAPDREIGSAPLIGPGIADANASGEPDDMQDGIDLLSAHESPGEPGEVLSKEAFRNATVDVYTQQHYSLQHAPGTDEAREHLDKRDSALGKLDSHDEALRARLAQAEQERDSDDHALQQLLSEINDAGESHLDSITGAPAVIAGWRGRAEAAEAREKELEHRVQELERELERAR